MHRRLVLVAAALAVLGVVSAPAKAAPAQVASSSSGLIASGGVWSQDMVLADGSSLDFNVMLVVPQGQVTATPASNGLDLGRPWVHVDVWKHDNVDHTATQICNTVSHPQQWSAGALNPQHAFTDHNYWDPTVTTTHYAPAWEGVQADVPCDDGSGHQSFRVAWELDRSSWLSQNPLGVSWAVPRARQWSASNAVGTITLSPTAYSTHPVRVCGSQSNGSVDCYGGHGQVVPMIDGMTTTVGPTSLSP
ncbi:MAG: hypothetical protein M3394_07895 [Actinomycetota bacterium]|nr:hypothetical protein [Actinomycetota bacterium]